jgi:hypothetical protein
MSELHLIRKRCPHCGKAMKLVPDETRRGGTASDTSAPPARGIRCTTPPPKNGRTVRCARRLSSFRKIRPWRRCRLSILSRGLTQLRRGPDFSGKSRNFIFGHELASGEVCSRRSRTWSATSRCALRYIRSGPSTWRGIDVDAADTRPCLLERHLQGRWEARVSDAEELTGFGLAYLERLPEDEC